MNAQGKKCLTVVNAELEYDVENKSFPLVTTRKSFYKAAIAELLGYLRGYQSAAQFRSIGCNTWNANANENKAWLANPHRKGEDDMGRVYGVQGRSWQKPDGSILDQLTKLLITCLKGLMIAVKSSHSIIQVNLSLAVCVHACTHIHFHYWVRICI